ncbi:uncharacterized protein K452DRAFT_17584 [Aplosporella prunicola CBS 121167]|uniref:Extracellular membrane protein CFEM domain-containing protein n=1 Tax=Aplosporella prunicola CBS 121167 TaxID=1176127 RepID=A0A6A6BDV9_9PEZI|nr:uncharacterized protein K452DRAFT_17584 [Aplosporella prunicola CBS 121167]KAF2142369.1 hypothetical protein K452DRAFT_17584 [Aplosporella prunicola CBS 121167]
MRFSVTVLLCATVGLAAAQSATSTAAGSSPSSSGSDCPAQNILDACLDTLQPRAAACPANDWVCLCNTHQDILTCYNNCPGLPARSGVQSQVASYCGAAAPALSSSSEAAKTRPSASATSARSGSGTATGSGSAATTTGFDSLDSGSSSSSTGGSESGSGSGSSERTSTAAANAGSVARGVQSGGVLAAVMGFAALL